MGRTRTDRAQRGPFVLIPAIPLVLAAVGLAGCGERGNAGTTITSARDAVVIATDGTTSAATAGRKLHDGEAVRTAATGAAILSTGGRVAYLGYDTVFYPRSAGAQVRRGAVIIDGRRGAKASIDVGDVSVSLPKEGVLRIERTAAVRIGVLAGSARVRSSSGSELDIAGYHQAVLVGRVLPHTTTPLVLTDDPAERVVVPDLVADDEALLRTARALDSGSDGLALVAAATRDGFVAPASSTGEITVDPAVSTGSTVKPSEVALPVAIGRAATRGSDRAAVAAATKQALQLRRQNGSWGVVARLVGTTSSGVSAAIDTLLGGSLPPGSGPVVGPTGGPVITLPGGRDASGSDGTGSTPTPRPSSGGPRPTKSPTPTPSPSSPVDQLRDVVNKIAPTPLPSVPGAPLLNGPLNP